jgi:ABC-type sugar transport system ATPase subunit
MNDGLASSVLLRASSITKDFSGQRVLDNVSLSLHGGQIQALLGENGAGKSTLIKILTGVYAATSGEIAVAGEPVSIMSPHDAQAAGIAVVHQHGNLVASLSVEENLLLGNPLPTRMGAVVDWKAVRTRAAALLERVNMPIDPRTPVQALRPDQVAMVSIAKALATNAKIIILDEPTAALAPAEVELLFAQMRRLAAQGRAFLYVSHRLNEIFDIADSATILRDGKLAWSCQGRDLLTREDVVSAIVGKEKGLLESHGSHEPQGEGKRLLESTGLRGAGVSDCSFCVNEGEIIGLAGLPDSGAEETLDLLFGRARANGGEVRLRDQRVYLHSPREAIRNGFAFVPKDRLGDAVVHGFSVRANITLASLERLITDPITRLVRRKTERRAANRLAKRLNIRSASIEADIQSLSGGNQQKVILARWLATDAKVLLLNSPTAAVDIGAKAEIYELLRQIAQAGRAILFASTEFDEFARVCDRVLVFRGGTIVGELAGPSINEANILHFCLGENADPLSGGTSHHDRLH